MIKKILQRSVILLLIIPCIKSAPLYGNHQFDTSANDTIQTLNRGRYKINYFKQYVQTLYSTDVYWEPADDLVQLRAEVFSFGYQKEEYTEKFVQLDRSGESVFLHPTWISLIVNEENKVSSRVVLIDPLGETKFFESNKLYLIKNDRSIGIPYVLYLQIHADFADIDALRRFRDIGDIIPEIELQIDSKLK